MMARSRRVLISGFRANFWKIRAGTLVLFHPDWSGNCAEVPAAHLSDEDEFLRHVGRLRSTPWVSEAAVKELHAIRDGWRP